MKLCIIDGPEPRRTGPGPAFAAAVLLALAGASLPLAAQEGAPDTADGEAAAEVQEPMEAPEAPAGDSADPLLEDYEASEQISEDLSVSFPVDI